MHAHKFSHCGLYSYFNRLDFNFPHVIFEMQGGRLPIGKPEPSNYNRYLMKYKETRRILNTKQSPEEKAVGMILSAMQKEGLDVPKSLLSVSVQLSVTITRWEYHDFKRP